MFSSFSSVPRSSTAANSAWTLGCRAAGGGGAISSSKERLVMLSALSKGMGLWLRTTEIFEILS